LIVPRQSTGEEPLPLGGAGVSKETIVQTTFICPRTSAALSFDIPADEAAPPMLRLKTSEDHLPGLPGHSHDGL
jgi:hypothetical protein